MSKLKIKKDATDNKVKFKIDEENYKEFNYDNLEKVIDLAVKTDNEIDTVIEEEGLEDYKILIDSIIAESRTEDFKNAVIDVENHKRTYEESIEDKN